MKKNETRIVEVDGEQFEVLSFVPWHVEKARQKCMTVTPNGEIESVDYMALAEVMVKGMVVKPKLGDEWFKSDDCDAKLVMDIFDAIRVDDEINEPDL